MGLIMRDATGVSQNCCEQRRVRVVRSFGMLVGQVGRPPSVSIYDCK